MAEYLQAPPRKKALGLLADTLTSGQNALNTVNVPYLGGLGGLLLGQAPQYLEDISYGMPAFRGGNVATGGLGTLTPDTRMLDVATLPFVGAGAAKVGQVGAKTLGKEVARQVETGTGLLGSNVMNPRTNIVPVDNAKGLLQSSTKLAPELKQPFIGYMTKDGFTEMFNHEAAKAADYHHSHLMKDPDKYLDDNALSFVRMGGENVFTVKGNAILDPYKKDSSKQLGILAKKLINEGADPQAPFYVEDLALPKIEAPYQGKQIGTLQDWLKYTK